MYSSSSTKYSLPYQNVVRFNVCMKNTAPLHQLECHEQLLSIRSHCLDVKANILAISLQHFSQIHAAITEIQQPATMYIII